MSIEKIFPIILILLQFGASVVYGYFGNIRMMVYWFAAAVVNAAVTF